RAYHLRGGRRGEDEADAVDLPDLLRLYGERRSKADSENDREPDQPHGHLGGGWLAGSLAERHDGHQRAGRDCTGARARMRYWIISSARIRSDCGIVKPSALAVLRLITNSNLVGCSTGRSLGFAPFRILST